MKPALVTGASGFIGWHVARVLLERGYRVRASSATAAASTASTSNPSPATCAMPHPSTAP
jgi:nucleoside-diphosphate-sugar epimerase